MKYSPAGALLRIFVLLAFTCLSLPLRSATLIVTNLSNSGKGSLSQAISDANTNANSDMIAFALAGAGVKTINLSNSLPPILYPVTIDGTTQPGYAGKPLIELNG